MRTAKLIGLALAALGGCLVLARPADAGGVHVGIHVGVPYATSPVFVAPPPVVVYPGTPVVVVPRSHHGHMIVHPRHGHHRHWAPGHRWHPGHGHWKGHHGHGHRHGGHGHRSPNYRIVH